MEADFHYKNMLPPDEVLPNGTCECKCLAEELAGWFRKCTAETVVFDFPHRIDAANRCMLTPHKHPLCSAISCPGGRECSQQWANQFGMARGSHTVAQWQCPGGNTALLGDISFDGHLLGFGKVVLRTPPDPMHTSLIKSAVHGTLREMELAIENSILKWRLNTGGQSSPDDEPLEEQKLNQGHPAASHAIEYIGEHYRDHALSLATVAAAVGISPCYLSGLFRDATGETFHEYVRNLRLATARDLMANTNLPPSEVARRSGFSSPRNLRRAIQQAEAGG